MAHKSYIVLRKDSGYIDTHGHPYSSLIQAKEAAADLSIKDPGVTYYIATIEMKVRTEPFQPIFEYFF